MHRLRLSMKRKVEMKPAPTFKKKAYCLSCRQYLEEEYVGPHKSLAHRVDFYLVGGYKRTDEVVEKKEERSWTEGIAEEG